MKLRYLLTIWAVLLISFQLNAQSQLRNPVLEYCTGAWCQWCPCGHQIIRETIMPAVPNAIVIGYHGPANTSSDPWSGFSGNQIISALSLSSYPTGIADRTSAPVSRGSWLAAVSARAAVPATVGISLEKNFNASSRLFTVTVKSTPIVALSGLFRLSVVLTESGMVYTQTGNASCTGGSDYIHEHVVRTFLNNYLGDTLSTSSWAIGQMVSKTYTYTLPADWNAAKCNVAAFVYQVGSTLNTSEIQQGVEAPVFSQPVTVLSPNGSENWYVGLQKNIMWSVESAQNVKIEYTTNNGTSWNVIAASVPAASNTYQWTVANTPSTQCKVRVSDVANASAIDESNAAFSIVAQPVSGWVAVSSGTSGDIWGVDFLDANNVWISSSTGDVKKSTDGGATFTAAGNAGAGAYSIAVLTPTTAVVALGPSSGDGKIMRTTDGGTTWTQVYTTSGAWFNFIDNTDANNVWALSDPIPTGGQYHIVKSTDGGATWALAPNRPNAPGSDAAGANNSFYRIGNTAWFGSGGLVSAPTTANKLFKSTNNYDGPWTSATATVQSVGSVAFSSATGNGLVGFWSTSNKLNKSADGGATLTEIATTAGVPNGIDYVQGSSTAYVASTTGIFKTTNDGTTWTAETIPTGFTDIKFIRVCNPNLAIAGAASGGLLRYVGFTPVGTITVLAPNGGENWMAGSQKSITWSSTDVSNVKIEYTIDNGTTWNVVAASVSAASGTYTWTVPSTPSTLCKVKISDASSASVSDMSNGVFTISSSSPAQWTKITTGMTGDIWGIDYVDQNVVWISSSTGEVKRSTDGGNTFIAAGNPGDGTYAIAALSATSAVVATGPSSGDGKIFRTTDGGTTWTAVHTTAGAWFNFIDNLDANNLWALSDPIPAGGQYYIVKSTDGGATWATTLNRPTAPGSNVYGANNGWYRVGNVLWFGTGGASGATAANKVFRSAAGVDGPWTSADATDQFTGALAFSSATGNGLVGFWQAANKMNKTTDGGLTLSALTTTTGTVHTIEYVNGTSTAYAGGTTGIFKTTDDGTTWTNETIPAGVTEIDFIRFFNAGNALAGGPAGVLLRYGSAPAGSVAVLTPNGGESWQGNSQQIIRWTSSNVTNVKLEYTINNGTNWTVISASLPATPAAYTWTVPNTPSQQCKVRISDASNAAVTDLSDAVFTITAAGPTITWQHTLNIKDGGTDNVNLIFGTSPQATDGMDAALGEAPLPPFPPTGVFDGRFELPITPADYSIKDFRNDTNRTISWVAKFQPGGAGYPVRIKWNAASLPSGTFSIKDNVTGTIFNINMRTTDSLVITNTGISAVKIEYSSQTCKDIVLSSGWNIVSVPVTAASMATGILFPAATSPAWGYANNYVMSAALALGKGYFIRYPQATTINVCGTPTALRTIPVVQGWNLIGTYDMDAPTRTLTTTPAGILATPFYGYTSSYTQDTLLKVGKGYWVKTSQAGTINLASTLAKGGEPIAELKFDKDWGKVVISDAAGNVTTLYIAKSALTNAASYELPPVPPAGVFDVRFSSQRVVDYLGGEQKDIAINSAVYPVEIRAEGVDIKVADKATNGKLISGLLKSGNSIRVSDEAVSVLSIAGSDIPVSYQLFQNYPNPFNPSTTIKFALPEKANVHITIFDQLGQKITDLVNEQREAGTFEVTWNAANMPSGVYFYEIRTDKFTATKKLMLMK